MAQENSMKKFWQEYNLSIVLFGLFLASWIAHAAFNWYEYVFDAEAHNQAIVVSEYLVDFFTRTFENWQSEFLQLFSMVVLTAYLVHKGSTESKDSQEQMQQSLDRIERQLKALKR